MLGKAVGRKPRQQVEAWLPLPRPPPPSRDRPLGAGQAWLRCRMHREECTLRTSEGHLPEPSSTENTDMEALSPRWVSLGLGGEGASTGEFRFFFVVFYFCF